MPEPRRRRANPYRLYLYGIEAPLAVLIALAQTTCVVYYVTSGHLNPLQLVTLGTSVELSYFATQLPTGLLADLVSRRLCVITGTVLTGTGLAEQGLSPDFTNLLVGQFVIGLGAALQEGALDAWIADELDEHRMTPVYLRATQVTLAGSVLGAVLSALLATRRLYLPLLLGGSAVVLVGAALAATMPEHRTPAPAPQTRRARARLLRAAWTGLARQCANSKTAITAVPGFALLLGAVFFTGLWSESFDRLWGDFLLHDIRLPNLLGLHPADWFATISITVSLLALASTRLAANRTEHPDGRTTGRTLLALTGLICAGVLVMAAAGDFAVAIGAYLFVQALRPVSYPLLTGWIVARVDPGVRATVLSARDMFDSAGQIAGGPVVGWIGVTTTIRTALYAGALALLPALALLRTATTRMRPRTTAAPEPECGQTPG